MSSSMLYTSKPRPSTQSGWQRRRFTKSAATVDGEYDPDLALAIQESLKQAEIDALKAKERQEATLSKAEYELSNSNNNHGNGRRAYSSGSSGGESTSETKQLKDLVCSHMDLIQQQQDVINHKEKTIKSLRAENNALQCRLQRMERRMALLKQKEDMSASPHVVSSPPPKPGTMSYTEPIALPVEKLSNKRKSESTPLSRRPNEIQKLPMSRTVSAKDSSNKFSKSRDSHRKRKLSTVQNSESESESNVEPISYYEPSLGDLGIDSEDLLPGVKSQREIEVPTFRIKTYTNLYVIEGTEDHEDETFMRRHQKPEIEEKRRKRWDNQRQRDEKMYEKMREKQESNNKVRKSDNSEETFHPHLEDITHIEVCDKIPASAMGKHVPQVKQQAFTQNWAPRQSPRTRQK